MIAGETGYAKQIEDGALALLRIVAALLFFQHGVQKWFDWPPGGHAPADWPLFSIFGMAAMLEFGGGLLLMFGLFARPVAFILSGEMAFAYWSIHVPDGADQPAGWMPVANGGDLAILFCFVFLYLFAAGPGALSLDARRGHRGGKKVDR